MSQLTSSSNSSRRARHTCCCAGCGLVPLLLLVPVYLAVTPPKPPPPLAPSAAAHVDAALSEKKADIEKIARDVSAGKPSPFTLVLREAEINRLLETDERLQRALRRERVEKAWVTIAEGRVRATAIREGAPASLTITVIPRVDSSRRLKLDIEGVDVGQLGVPAVSAIRRAAEKAVGMLANKSIMPQADFNSVTAENGAITLTGTGK